jgi:hypothetical protein
MASSKAAGHASALYATFIYLFLIPWIICLPEENQRDGQGIWNGHPSGTPAAIAPSKQLWGLHLSVSRPDFHSPQKKSSTLYIYGTQPHTRWERETHTAERERVKVVVDNDFCPWIDPSFCPASKDGPAAASLTTCIACVSFYIPLFYTALFYYTSLFFRSGEWCAVCLLPTFPFLLCAQSFLDFISSLFFLLNCWFFSFFIVPFPYFQSCNKSNIARCGAWDGRRSRPGPARPVPFPQRVSLSADVADAGPHLIIFIPSVLWVAILPFPFWSLSCARKKKNQARIQIEIGFSQQHRHNLLRHYKYIHPVNVYIIAT